MAAFKNKANGTWYVQFRYTDWKGERQQKLKRGFATKKEAQAWEREFLMQKQADVNMTFESFAQLYEKDMKPKLKLNTWLTKESIIQKKILPYFGKRKLSEITAKDVMDWQNAIRGLTDAKGKPYSPTYLKTVHNQLSALFNHAVRYYGLQVNPAAKAGNMGVEERREMLFWTKEEYLKFADAMMDKPLSYYAFEMLYWTGIREGELLALSPADIDLDNKTIPINRTYQRIEEKDVFTSPKTRKSKRKIPIPDFLCQKLSDYIQSRYMLDADERLFPVTKSFLSHEMIRGCKNTGVKKIRIHNIRHSHASLLINQGCDALMLADRLGHEKVSTTLNTYSHLFPHKQQELVHSLESLQATDSPTPEPPSDNPLLEAAGITCEVPQTQDNGSDVTIRPQFGPALVPPNTASGKIIQMPQRKII